MDVCHRTKGNSDGKSNIVVKFTHRDDLHRILDAKKTKKDLSVRHLGMASDNKIFINLSLTRKRRILLSKSKAYKRSHPDIKYVWADRAGRIKIMKVSGETRVIQCESDLDDNN
ncbi:uncharacterized protein LOC120353553 [Nilaparvata lugens]|nr:uncharacterized protein LOC120353553 [Nilaparvata lugens]